MIGKITIIKKLVLGGLSIILLASCSAEQPAGPDDIPLTAGQGHYEKIGPQQAKEMMDLPNSVILDVRTVAEVQEGHIPDAILIPLDGLQQSVESEIPDKDTIILVYCRTGNRSQTAGKLLIELGYKQVYDFGGINTWSEPLVFPERAQ